MNASRRNMNKAKDETSPAARTAKAKRMAAAAERVRKVLGITTLADRGTEALDAKTLSVGDIREVLAIAFEAGYDAGFDAAETLNG